MLELALKLTTKIVCTHFGCRCWLCGLAFFGQPILHAIDDILEKCSRLQWFVIILGILICFKAEKKQSAFDVIRIYSFTLICALRNRTRQRALANRRCASIKCCLLSSKNCLKNVRRICGKSAKALIVFACQLGEHCVCPIADGAMDGLVSSVKWPLPRTNNKWLRAIAVVFSQNMESILPCRRVNIV